MTTTTIQIALFTLLIGSSAQSQSVAEWTQSHPEVLLINSEDATSELLNRLDQSSTSYIVYSEELRIEDIEMFNENRPVSGVAEILKQDLDESEFLKLWISNNPNVKIISRSLYDQMDADNRSDYNSNTVIIMEGEFLTLSDVENFEENRREATEFGTSEH